MTSTDQQVARLNKGLYELAYPAASRASGKAIKSGLRVFDKAIAAAAPIGPTRKVKGVTVQGGSLKKSVGSRFLKGRRGVMRAKSGLNVGKGRPVAKGSSERRGNLAPHSPWVTLGTQDRYTGAKKGKATGNARARRGRVSPNDFVRRASRAAEPAATQAVMGTLSVELQREIAKAAPGGRA